MTSSLKTFSLCFFFLRRKVLPDWANEDEGKGLAGTVDKFQKQEEKKNAPL